VSNVEQSIDVHVPVHAAYDQWTQFESFPQFMDGVETVTQLTDTKSHWVTRIAGVEREFDTEVTEQTPDQRIAWTSTEKPKQAGVVTFHRIEDGVTRVMLQMDFEPEGVLEKAGDALGIVKRRITGDLERFKSFIEERGAPTGAWRGEVEQDKV